MFLEFRHFNMELSGVNQTPGAPDALHFGQSPEPAAAIISQPLGAKLIWPQWLFHSFELVR